MAEEKYDPTGEVNPQGSGNRNPSANDDKVKKAKEAADVAEQELRRVDSEVQTKLKEKGWKTIEDGIKELAEKKNEIQKGWDELEKKKIEIYDDKKTLKDNIAEANEHRRISLEMKSKAEERWGLAILKEKEAEDRIALGEIQIKSLKDSVNYFNDNILPVLDTLKSIKSALYTEAERLQHNNSLHSLYQFISNNTAKIEDLLDEVVNVQIPEALLPKAEEENHEGQVETPSTDDLLHNKFTPIWNYLGNAADIFIKMGIGEFGNELWETLSQLDEWYSNNYVNKKEAILQGFKDIAKECEDTISDIIDSPKYNQHNIDAIIKNLSDMYKLLPILQPVE